MKNAGQPKGTGEKGKKKHPGGRPSKLTPQLAVKIFDLSRHGLTDKVIARTLDVTERSITNWKSSTEFFLSLKAAKKDVDSRVEESLSRRALGFVGPDGHYYPPETTACIFWLKNRQPQDWRDRIPELANIADSISSALQMMRRHEERTRKEKKA